MSLKWSGTQAELLPPLPEKVATLWPHQIPAINAAVQAFERGVRIVVLDAPPGSGKTIIGEQIRRRLKVQALYLCQSKQLQRQVCETFPYARLIMGRANYPVLDNFTVTTEECDAWRKGCQAKPSRGCKPDPEYAHCSWCHPMAECPYQVAKRQALASPLAVANTAYAFGEWQAAGLFKGFPLVILDEWDEVEDALLNSITVTLSMRDLARFGLTMQPPIDAQWFLSASKKIAAFVEQTQDNPPNDWPKIADLGKDLATAADGLASGDWVVTSADLQRGVSVCPLEIGALGHQHLWPNGEKWLLMSGTAISSRLRLKALGAERFLGNGQAVLATVPSTYPAARRPIRVWPVGSMRSKERPATVPKMASAILRILASHEDERILIHTGSYQIAKDLGDLMAVEAPVATKRVITFTSSRERDEALTRFLAAPASVLMGPAMERGLSLDDDACRVIVVCRVPYPYQGDPRVQARQKQGSWYVQSAIETIAALVQMTMRGMRHAEDSCTSYVLDSQLEKIRTHGLYEKYWPKWWAEALTPYAGPPIPDDPEKENIA